MTYFPTVPEPKTDKISKSHIFGEGGGGDLIYFPKTFVPKSKTGKIL